MGAAVVEDSASLGDTSTCSHGGIYSVDNRRVKLDFSSSLNPLGVPGLALQEIKKRASELVETYPDPDCRSLKEGLCDYLGHGIQANQLCVGNGALEIIHWFAHSFARKLAVIPSPTFCEYELATKQAGAKSKIIPLFKRADAFELDVEPTVDAAKNADALFLCNPNNPTGLLSTKSIETVLDGISDSTMVLLDECFIELSDRPSDSLLRRISDCKNLVILRSMTKSFALAGLRLGYSISSESVAKKLAEHKIHWNVNGIAQAAGVVALRAADKYLESARKLIFKERNYLNKGIKIYSKNDSVITTPLRSDANYLLVKLQGTSIDSTTFRNIMLEKTGVLVRDCSTFTGMGSNYIRVGVKNRKQNVKLIKALEKTIGTISA